MHHHISPPTHITHTLMLFWGYFTRLFFFHRTKEDDTYAQLVFIGPGGWRSFSVHIALCCFLLLRLLCRSSLLHRLPSFYYYC